MKNKKRQIILSLQLRQLVFNFAQKELAPKAAEIDKKNNFDELRVNNVDILKSVKFDFGRIYFI